MRRPLVEVGPVALLAGRGLDVEAGGGLGRLRSDVKDGPRGVVSGLLGGIEDFGGIDDFAKAFLGSERRELSGAALSSGVFPLLGRIEDRADGRSGGAMLDST